MKIEVNQKFKEFLSAFSNSSNHIFVTGRAGTGKSTLLNLLRENSDLNMAITAPTGVAAVNVEGETIHSFFGFKPAVTVDEAETLARRTRRRQLYQNLDVLVIDEISMVRSDLLDCLDTFLRIVRGEQRLFGGVRLVMFGDLFQLPPVVTNEEREALNELYSSPYFFSSRVFQDLLTNEPDSLKYIELEKIYRQTEKNFIETLNKIREKQLSIEDLAELNDHCLVGLNQDKDHGVVLTATNAQAEGINKIRLSNLEGKQRTYQGMVTGQFSEKQLPAEKELELKTNSQVMLLNNDQAGRWVNGTMGTVLKLSEEKILVCLDNQKEVWVEPFTWTAYRYSLNSESKKITREETGSFRQFPLKLAWAITIHKSQGKTFEKILVDLGERGAFAFGQVYVALSRCTSLAGLKLKRPLTLDSIKLDWQVTKFYQSLRQLYSRPDGVLSLP